MWYLLATEAWEKYTDINMRSEAKDGESARNKSGSARPRWDWHTKSAGESASINYKYTCPLDNAVEVKVF